MNKKKAIELAKLKKKNGIGRVGCQMSNGRDQLKITREKTEKILKKINNQLEGNHGRNNFKVYNQN